MPEPIGDADPSLLDRRIVVVTSQLDEGFNELWETVRRRVGELALVGAELERGRPSGSAAVALRGLDLGRGQIRRHLVGLRRFLKSFQPDLIHLNGELWGVTAQELLGLDVPIVVHGAENLWEHGLRIERWARRRLVNRAVRRVAGYASWNHDGAEHMRDLARHLGRTTLPTLVMPAVIPPPPFHAHAWGPPELGSGTTLDVLLVGRVVEMKGFATAIEAAARLTDRPVRITIAGEGPELPRLVDQAASLGVELRMLGSIDAEPLAATMARCHVQIQPSLTTSYVVEQFGRSVAEAMTVGLPCLVSDSGELPRVVGEDPRAIFREGDVGSLAVLLRHLTEAPRGLVDLSQHQRKLAQRYAADEAARAVCRFWGEVLE